LRRPAAKPVALAWRFVERQAPLASEVSES
jgi:hypothetical protein